MTGELYLDPQRATAAGRDLSAAGKQLVSLNNSTVAEVNAASQGQPWGRDDIGAAFQQNYGPLLQQFTDAFGKISGYVQGLGDAAIASVEDNLGADARSSGTVTKSYGA
ncbi:hypothetical protein Aca07nite_77330 [Actinoplanes capillaceus]|uniref:Excreted virulence factor EspC, type VII ESX diderm n=1 Tax=Actinoplanes campanulatus TaxID=113559 RepID=A0ABQ3WVX5_9ACTN|nr:hypothetical protein [Actinoplanes capillaceus]GID50458.1 hypothetical protein Aca07nite_77330 [Actinoplanes capillaceus]